MGYYQDGSGIVIEVILQPFHRIYVQMIGRLIQQQYAGAQGQQARQVEPGLLPPLSIPSRRSYCEGSMPSPARMRLAMVSQA